MNRFNLTAFATLLAVLLTIPCDSLRGNRADQKAASEQLTIRHEAPVADIENTEQTFDLVTTRSLQVFPKNEPGAKWVRTPGQQRAIILLNGLQPQLPSFLATKEKQDENGFAKPVFSDWQDSNHLLVLEMSKNGDVFSFAYSQNVSLDKIAATPGLANTIRHLRQMGYQDITLVGHSAGGVLARMFVEDHVDSGVSKVIQVCAPNGGSSLTGLASPWVPEGQMPFISSLSQEARQRATSERAGKSVPSRVQFVAVVVKLEKKDTDGVVKVQAQWPEDLQQQGVPAVGIDGNHMTVMDEKFTAMTLSRLIRENHPRTATDRMRTSQIRLGTRDLPQGELVAR